MPRIFLAVSVLLALAVFAGFPSNVSAAMCYGMSPPVPYGVKAAAGPKSGEITLSWNATPWIDRYDVVYGTKTNNYIYGGNKIGWEQSSSYTVGSLVPKRKYFFKLMFTCGNGTPSWSKEVSAWTF